MARKLKQRATREYPSKQDRRSSRFQPKREFNDDWRAERDRVIEMDTRFARNRKPVVLIPRTVNQETLINALQDASKTVVVAHGPAGTGKTMLCSHHAVDMLRDGIVSKIVITRPNVAVDDRDIGHLPGTLLEKMKVWIAPIEDYLKEFYSKAQLESMLENDIIEVVPIAHMRGRTFKNSVVLIDECQGLTANAFKSVLTRVGDGSRIFLTGDCEQSDIGSENGLSDFLVRYDGNTHMAVVGLSQVDVQRHAAVSAALRMYA